MRTGPFSSTEVIQRLNAAYVPVYTVNEDYADGGPAPREEKAEVNRVRRETLALGKSSGSVHVYLIAPDGSVADSMHVAEAAQTPKLLRLLDATTERLGTRPGPPLAAPRPQSVAPAAPPGALTLHLTARPLSPGGSWDGVSENWLVFTREEAKRLLPTGTPRPGDAWKPDPETAARLLRFFYPVTENNDETKNRIEAQSLTGTVLSGANGVVRARLDGALRMVHWFYHKDDGKKVDTAFAGYVEFDARRKTVRRLRLATTDAAYNGGTFGVAVRSVP